jgi:SAM-dependent methyltransferase
MALIAGTRTRIWVALKTGNSKPPPHDCYLLARPSFLKRALALFPDARDILHCPSGSIHGVPGITVDKVRDGVRCPQVRADASALPFADSSFDLILSDPPYSDLDAQKYGTGHFPLRKAMREFHRVLRPHGHLGLLHLMFPSFSNKVWKCVATIGVLTGTNARVRVFSIFECLKEAPGMKP